MDTVRRARRRLLCLRQRRLDQGHADSRRQAELRRRQRSWWTETRQQTVDIIQDPVKAGPNATADARKVGDFYASFMDEAGIESKGTRAVEAGARRHCARLPTSVALARAIGGTLRADVDPLNATNFQTEHLLRRVRRAGADRTRITTVPYCCKAAWGCRTATTTCRRVRRWRSLRTGYKRHVAAVLALAGFTGAAAARRAHRRSRDADGGGARHSRAVGQRELAAGRGREERWRRRRPALDWPALLEAAGLKDAQTLHRLASVSGDRARRRWLPACRSMPGRTGSRSTP